MMSTEEAAWYPRLVAGSNMPRFRVSAELARRQMQSAPQSAFAFLTQFEEPTEAHWAYALADLSEGILAMLAGLAAELRHTSGERNAWTLLSEHGVDPQASALIGHALGTDDGGVIRSVLEEVCSWVSGGGGHLIFEWGALRTQDRMLQLEAFPLPLDAWAAPRDATVRHVTASTFFHGTTSHSSFQFDEQTLRRAAEILAARSDNTLLPKAFEYERILAAWNDLGGTAASVDVTRHSIFNYRQAIAPKTSGGKRIATQLDPLDGLLQVAAVLELGSSVEALRVPASANIVHSFRFSGEGRLWSTEHTYATFRKRALELATVLECEQVVEADIEDFYHALPQPVVARALKRASPRSRLVDALMSMLRTFGPLGLPVGPTSSALFAEAALATIDEKLLASGLTYIRYSDDFIFFCTRRDAIRALSILEDALEGIGLSLQREKTRITPRDEFMRTAKIDAWLADLQASTYDEAVDGDEEHPLPISASDDVSRARKLVLDCLGPDHMPWIRIGREALKALPFETRLEVMPDLLANFSQLEPMAASVSSSVERCGSAITDSRDGLLVMVLNTIIATGPAGPDFGRAWLMNAFTRGEWPEPRRLAITAQKWGSDQLLMRELLLAAPHNGASGLSVAADSVTDPWLRRAAVAAKHMQPSSRRDWSGLLEAAMLTSS